MLSAHLRCLVAVGAVTGDSYRYLNMDGVAYSLEPKRAGFALLLGCQTDAVRFDGGSRHPLLRSVPGPWLKYLRVARIVLRIRLARVLRPLGEVLQLPVLGDFAIGRRPRGHKVFDLVGRVVYTVEADLTPAAEQQHKLHRLRQLASKQLAPQVVAQSDRGEWYAEQWLPGSRVPPLWQDPECYWRYYHPLIEALQGGFAEQTVEPCLYRDDLLASATLIDGEHSEIARYLQRSAAAIESGRDERMSLLASHGDLTEKNILQGDTKALDWETFGFRTRWFDTFACFFSAFVRYRRTTGIEQHELLEQLLRVLDRRQHREMESQSDLTNRFRWFVLEWSAARYQGFLAPVQPLEDELWPARLQQVVEYVRFFEKFEQQYLVDA